MQGSFERKLHAYGGTWAASILPLGTVDYSRALNDVGSFRPQVLIDLMGGDDQTNSLRQIVRFGLTDDMAVGGALFELESILKVPDAARIGWWTMEWWWDQPKLPAVKSFDAAMRSRSGKAASARNWFGYAAVCTLAHIANQEKSLAAVALARALQGRALPGEITLAGASASFGESDHQLMSTILVGEVHPPRGDACDVFTTRAALKPDQAGEGPDATACRLAFPG